MEEEFRELVGKSFEEYSKVIEYFPFDLGSMEEEGLAAEGIVEGVVGLFLGFLLDNNFSGSSTGVVFFGSRLSLVFFLPDARIENVESPGEIFYPS
jgi:hypothetical protein